MICSQRQEDPAIEIVYVWFIAWQYNKAVIGQLAMLDQSLALFAIVIPTSPIARILVARGGVPMPLHHPSDSLHLGGQVIEE